VLLAVALALPAGAEARSCRLPPGATYNQGTINAVVYKAGRPNYPSWWVCWKDSGRRTRLAPRPTPRDHRAPIPIRLAGRYAAIVREHTGGSGDPTDDIYIYDIVAGRLRYKIKRAGHGWVGCHMGSLGDIALTRRSFVAWLTSRWTRPPNCSDQRRVSSAIHVHDSRGSRAVETGAGYVDDFHAYGDWVSWLRDDIFRSVRLR
jgi:hypothetical protein